MSDLYKNPETQPQDKAFENRLNDAEDWGGSRMNIAGPGGSSILSEHNEKGILEQGLFEAMRVHKQAALGSNHDSFAQGIYADSGEKYGD